MPRQNKYTPGEKITDVHDAVNRILVGAYIYHNDKPQHPSWMGSMSLITLDRLCRMGQLRRAMLNEAHPDNLKEVA